jgi:hypothetical protein
MLNGETRDDAMKYVYLIFLMLLSGSIAYADSGINIVLGPTHSPVPEFNVTFSAVSLNFSQEDITVTETYIKDVQNKKLNVTLTKTNIIDDYSKLNVYTSNEYLGNGNYSFYIEIIDEYGNKRNATSTFEILFDYLQMKLTKPRLGVAQKVPFDVQLETEDGVKNCRLGERYGPNVSNRTQLGNIYANMQNMVPLDSDKKIWYFNMSSFIAPESYYLYRFICPYLQDTNYQLTEYVLGYDTTPAIITTYPVNPKINDFLVRNINITINTSDPSICNVTTLNDGSVETVQPYDYADYADYTKNKLVNVDYSDVLAASLNSFAVSYEVSCINLAGFISKKNFSIEVNISNDLKITRITPEYLKTRSITFQVQTNVVAESCASGNSAFSSADKKTWNLLISNLTDGEQYINVYCRTTYQKDANATFRIYVDATKPTKPVITAGETSCSLDRLTAQFESEDNDSGVDRFNYSVYQGNTLIYAWVLSKEKNPVSVTISNLDLIQGKTYTWKVYAIDNAGNVGDTATKDVVVQNENTTACDDVPPDARIYVISNSSGIVRINMSCADAGSGCTGQYNYTRNRNTNADCNFTQKANLEFVQTFDQTELFCYKVFDKNNNYDTGRTIIRIAQQPCTNCTNPPNGTLCTNGYKDNGEADVDCGGNCPNMCNDGKKCTLSYDCASGYCTNATCKQPSCTDGQKNGKESDTDCGGNCTAKCSINKMCISNIDCKSGFICANNLCTIDTALDTDKDGLPDYWEYKYFNSSTAASPTDDPDRDGFSNLEEYKAQTNPTDKNSKPEKKSILPLILLILGIILVLFGIVYLLIKKSPETKEHPIFVQNTVERAENPEMPSNEVQKTTMIASRMFKKRTFEKTKEQKKKLLSSFDASEEKKQDMDPLPAMEVKKVEKPEEKKEVKKETRKKTDDEYVDVSELKKKQDLQKQDVKKQVFQKLEGLAKQAKLKPIEKKAETLEDSTDKDGGQTISKSAKATSKLSNKEVFDKLAELANQPKQKVHSVMKQTDNVTVEKMMDIFAKVTDKKQINQDVFKVILAELLAKGKLDKKTVSEILFKFMDQNLLTKREVTSIMKDLKLL